MCSRTLHFVRERNEQQGEDGHEPEEGYAQVFFFLIYFLQRILNMYIEYVYFFFLSFANYIEYVYM